jgi:3-phenylpropionate/cinnamic acid dioxygenase small subunit
MSDPQVEGFLYREARFMDEHRFDQWLALWSSPALYWVPCNEDDIDPKRQVSIIYDDYTRLVQRIDRLKSGSVQAMDPKPRMRRLIANVEVENDGAQRLTVGSNFLLCMARAHTQQIWCGRSIHVLRREADDFKIAEKKVLLINSDQEMPLLQFLI